MTTALTKRGVRDDNDAAERMIYTCGLDDRFRIVKSKVVGYATQYRVEKMVAANPGVRYWSVVSPHRSKSTAVAALVKLMKHGGKS